MCVVCGCVHGSVGTAHSPCSVGVFCFVSSLQALDAWHERGWVHCDLKSENMGVDPSGSLFLFDLGLAVKLDTPASLKPMGGPVGTAALMAPELANEADGHLLSTAADVYSACTCVRELLEHVRTASHHDGAGCGCVGGCGE